MEQILGWNAIKFLRYRLDLMHTRYINSKILRLSNSKNEVEGITIRFPGSITVRGFFSPPPPV